MIWTNRKPTEPGWYWCRNAGEYEGQIWEAVVRVDKMSDGRMICGWMKGPHEGGVMTEDEWSEGCLWAGPIQPPSSGSFILIDEAKK